VRDRDLVIAAILLWLFWPKQTGSSTVTIGPAYVEVTPQGPVPFVPPPEPIPSPIPTDFGGSNFIDTTGSGLMGDPPAWQMLLND
jgi:hypothetical protein